MAHKREAEFQSRGLARPEFSLHPALVPRLVLLVEIHASGRQSNVDLVVVLNLTQAQKRILRTRPLRPKGAGLLLLLDLVHQSSICTLRQMRLDLSIQFCCESDE